MSAAGRREELEAAAWRAITDASVSDHGTGPCPPCQRNVDAILAAGDAYAQSRWEAGYQAAITELGSRKGGRT